MYWRVTPFWEGDSCHVGKRLAARAARSAGWFAEKMMAWSDIFLSCRGALVSVVVETGGGGVCVELGRGEGMLGTCGVTGVASRVCDG